MDWPHWRDLIDILLLGLLLQRIFLLFRRTHAVRILATIGVLVALELGANHLGLVLTSWFFQAVRPVVILILVVAFRNELREMILRNDTLLGLFGRGAAEVRLDLQGLASEVFQLARDQIGALIVLRGRESLQDHVTEGIILNGRFDPRLLRSIFVKESPVHDGAVVIQESRIARVGSILPLSRRSDIPAEYGTRHRAGLGISERTDAVVLVVSEERGDVSVVHKGTVTEAHDPVELEALLLAYLGSREPTSPGRDRIIRIARSLVGLALSCGLVALYGALYLGKLDTVTQVEAKLEFRNLAENMVLDRISHERAVVQIAGRQPIVDALQSDQVRVSVDLAGVPEGRSVSIPLGADDVQLPPGLVVREITPSRLTVDLIRQTRKALVIEPRTSGEPPPGLAIESISINPRQIEVVGPATTLQSSEPVATTPPIDLGRLEAGQTEQTSTVDILLYPVSIKPLLREPPRARVTIRYRPASPVEASSDEKSPSVSDSPGP